MSENQPHAVEIVLDGVTYRYGAVPAVESLTFAVRPGEMFGLLGPSGCGKTTTLRILAGFIRPDSGTVRFGEREVTGLPPEERQIGMVFQNYALFPHMTVSENVAFGLVARGLPKPDRARRVAEALDLVHLRNLAQRPVGDLSGGQQQRVALARAIVVEPSVLLLDEPLSNLDARLRAQTGAELRLLQRRLGITTLYVTHDQNEALTLCDRLAVMREGRSEQIGTPEEVFLRPGSRFVADFLGRANILAVDEFSATASGWTARVGPHRLVGSPAPLGRHVAALVIRPHAVAVHPRDSTPRGENTFDAEVVGRRFLGSEIELALAMGGVRLTALVRPAEPGAQAPVGSAVQVHLPPDAILPIGEESASSPRQ